MQEEKSLADMVKLLNQVGYEYNQQKKLQEERNLANMLNLLNQMNGIYNQRKKSIAEDRKNGMYFNIFHILDVEHDEVKTCRLLFELLNPEGSHGQGALYLKLFFRDVLRLPDYNMATVSREYSLPTGRRIDLVIETGKDCFIPIEVKLYADDQDKQCYDYYQEAKKKAHNYGLYYLTLDGHSPSEKSCKGLTAISRDSEGHVCKWKEITCISFATDILTWLQDCIDQTEGSESIRNIICQFITDIKILTNSVTREEDMKAKEILMQSKKNMQSAALIYQGFREARTELLTYFFSEMEKKIGKNKVENDEYDYTQKIMTFYDVKGSTWPGISYYCKHLHDDIDLWFRIEISHELYFGFCTPKNGKSSGRQLSQSEEIELFGHSMNDSGWWLNWEYLPLNTREGGLNFKCLEDNPNDEQSMEKYFDLYEKDKRDAFIDQCYQRMKSVTEQFFNTTGFQLS